MGLPNPQPRWFVDGLIQDPCPLSTRLRRWAQLLGGHALEQCGESQRQTLVESPYLGIINALCTTTHTTPTAEWTSSFTSFSFPTSVLMSVAVCCFSSVVYSTSRRPNVAILSSCIPEAALHCRPGSLNGSCLRPMFSYLANVVVKGDKSYILVLHSSTILPISTVLSTDSIHSRPCRVT